MSNKKSPEGAAPLVRLGDIVDNINDFFDHEVGDTLKYVAGEHIDEGDLRVRRYGQTSDDLVPPTFSRLFKAGDVLFHSRNIRKLARPDFDGLTGEKLFVLRSKDSAKLLQEFLPFLLQSAQFGRYVEERWAGSTNKFLNKTPLMAFEFSLPSVEKQRRAVRLLGAIDGQCEALLGALTAATKIRKSMARRIFSAVDYPKVKMGSVAEVKNGSTPRRARDDYWKGSIPWLPTGKVNERVILSADEFITDKALAECSVSLIPAGATLVAMIGEGQTRGRAAMLTIDACINQNFGAVVPGKALDPWYLFYLLDSNYEALRHWSQGTNQHALSCGLLKSFPISVPPLAVQQDVVAQLKEVESTEALLSARLAKSRELRRVCHSMAFAME